MTRQKKGVDGEVERKKCGNIRKKEWTNKRKCRRKRWNSWEYLKKGNKVRDESERGMTKKRNGWKCRKKG